MYERRLKGLIGETKVLLELTKQEYEVYLPFGDCASCDMIAVKDGATLRVSVKYTAYSPSGGSWIVCLTNVSRRNNGKVAVKKFDNTSCDILAVYIGPEDRVVLLNAKDIITKNVVSIKRMDAREEMVPVANR